MYLSVPCFIVSMTLIIIEITLVLRYQIFQFQFNYHIFNYFAIEFKRYFSLIAPVYLWEGIFFVVINHNFSCRAIYLSVSMNQGIVISSLSLRVSRLYLFHLHPVIILTTYFPMNIQPKFIISIVIQNWVTRH